MSMTRRLFLKTDRIVFALWRFAETTAYGFVVRWPASNSLIHIALAQFDLMVKRVRRAYDRKLGCA